MTVIDEMCETLNKVSKLEDAIMDLVRTRDKLMESLVKNLEKTKSQDIVVHLQEPTRIKIKRYKVENAKYHNTTSPFSINPHVELHLIVNPYSNGKYCEYSEHLYINKELLDTTIIKSL